MSSQDYSEPVGKPPYPAVGKQGASHLCLGGLQFSSAGTAYMMVMKLPILPCAEKLELVLFTAPDTHIDEKITRKKFLQKISTSPITTKTNFATIRLYSGGTTFSKQYRIWIIYAA